MKKRKDQLYDYYNKFFKIKDEVLSGNQNLLNDVFNIDSFNNCNLENKQK